MKITIILLLLAVVIVLLATEKVSYLGVSVIILSALTIFKIVAPNETLAELANPTIMLYVGTFMISAAFKKIRVTEMLGEKALVYLHKFSKKEGLVLFLISVFTAVLSIFLQALGVQVAMLTIILSLSDHLHINKKKALLTLGFSATIGSTFTLLGNNVTLLAKANYELITNDTWGFFELSLLTIPMGLLLISFFCFLTSRWIKKEDTTESVAVVEKVSEKSGQDNSVSRKAYCTVIGTTVVFLLAVLFDGKTPIPTNIVVLFCIAALVITKTLTFDEVISAINWPIILFTVSVLTLSAAMMDVGAGEYLSKFIIMLSGKEVSLRMLVAISYIVATIATQFLSNSGTFSIITPIMVSVAAELGFPAKPIIVAVCLASTLAFMTPLSAPSFPMLATAGRISFKEFFLQGGILTVITVIICVVFIPMLWG